MRARQLLDRSVQMFPAATMKVVYQAFDEAWAVIEPRVGADPRAIEAAREKLAEAVLAVSRHDSTDVDQIKRMALQVFRGPFANA
jgi:hypothetical protein